MFKSYLALRVDLTAFDIVLIIDGEVLEARLQGASRHCDGGSQGDVRLWSCRLVGRAMRRWEASDGKEGSTFRAELAERRVINVGVEAFCYGSLFGVRLSPVALEPGVVGGATTAYRSADAPPTKVRTVY